MTDTSNAIHESEKELLLKENLALKAGLDKIITEAEYFKQWCKDKRPHFTGMGAPIALLDIVIEQGKKLINNKK